MPRLRLGAVGLGPRANLIETALHHPDVELVALCDLVVDRHERPGGFIDRLRKQGMRPKSLHTDYAKLLECDLDFVMIATPPRHHASMAAQAMEAGFDVISEVPAACTVEEARELVRTVRKSGKRYYFAENCCYWGFIQSWKKMAREGRIGRISYAEGEYIHDLGDLFERDAWEEPGAGTEGKRYRSWRASLDPIRYCTHETGPLLQIMDCRVTTATAFSTPACVRPDLPSGADLQVAIFETSRGAVYKQLCGFSVTRHPSLHYYIVYGSRMTLETSREDGATLASFSDIPNMEAPARLSLGFGTTAPVPDWVRAGHGGADGLMMLDFITSLRDGTPPPIDVFSGLDFSLPGIFAVESIGKGNQKIAVPDPRDW